MSACTIYLEQDGEVLFEHKASTEGERDDKSMAEFAIQVWRLTGMKGYTVGKNLTARVEWDEAEDDPDIHGCPPLNDGDPVCEHGFRCCCSYFCDVPAEVDA